MVHGDQHSYSVGRFSLVDAMVLRLGWRAGLRRVVFEGVWASGAVLATWSEDRAIAIHCEN